MGLLPELKFFRHHRYLMQHTPHCRRTRTEGIPFMPLRKKPQGDFNSLLQKAGAARKERPASGCARLLRLEKHRSAKPENAPDKHRPQAPDFPAFRRRLRRRTLPLLHRPAVPRKNGSAKAFLYADFFFSCKQDVLFYEAKHAVSGSKTGAPGKSRGEKTASRRLSARRAYWRTPARALAISARTESKRLSASSADEW